MSRAMRMEPKRPLEVLDYITDWSHRIPEDDIVITEVYATSELEPLEVIGVSHESKRVKVWVAGGKAGCDHPVKVRVMASGGGRLYDRTVILIIPVEEP